MIEIRDGIRCTFAFGKDAREAFGSISDSIKATAFTRLNNPTPTGDHWKVIGWILDHVKRGSITLERVPNLRRDFIKKGATEFSAGNVICLEIGSMAARKFRDENDLRMLRGKVFVFVDKPIEILP